MSSAKAPTSAAPPLLMRMGCTNELITYRAAGNEGVCLQSPQHGMQNLANFNPAIGDFLGVDDILEQTLAHDNLSDIASYITSTISAGGTTLYVDMTGSGKQGTPFAFLQGVSTTVAALVAEGGIKYIPDQVAITPAFNTPLTIRPDGLETVLLRSMVTGMGAQEIINFNAAANDKIELANILNRTAAAPNLSNIASYITATDVNGNTILSVDKTGAGQPGVAFAQLDGLTVTVAQLVAAGALEYDPTNIRVFAAPSTTLTYRAAGTESAMLPNITGTQHAVQLAGFSLANGDGINVDMLLTAAGIAPDFSSIASFLTATQSGANTDLWFNPSGGTGGTLEAIFQNTTVTINDLLAHSALHLTI